MKHRCSRSLVFILLVVILLFAALPALALEQPSEPGYTVTLEKDKLTLYTGDAYTLTPPVFAFAPGAAQTAPAISYSSSDPWIADVDAQGVITAYNKGSAVITAKTEHGVQDSLKLTVKQSLPLTAISLPTDHYYAVYHSATGKTTYWNGKKYVSGVPALKPVLSPKKTTQKELVYASSDPSLVAINEKGGISILGAPEGGKAKAVTITVTSANNAALTQQATLTVAPDSAAFQTPYYMDGVWCEKSQAPKQFRVGDKEITVSYHSTVQDLNIYTDGNVNTSSIRQYLNELQGASPVLTDNPYIDYIIMTERRITSFFPDFHDGDNSIIIGFATYDTRKGANSGIVLDTYHYEMGTMIHELAHMWDFCVSGSISDSSEVRQLFREEKFKVSVPKEWLTEPAEFLAYSIEDYFLRSGYFRAAAPKTTAFLDRLFGAAEEHETEEQQAA